MYIIGLLSSSCISPRADSIPVDYINHVYKPLSPSKPHHIQEEANKYI